VSRRRVQLTPELVLQAYRTGYFPMADPSTGEIFWYSPDPRAILPLYAFHTPRSLRQRLRKGLFSLKFNTAFLHVIRSCADREETWISEEIIQVYAKLHEAGHAHSVETWAGEHLAGGLYGVSLGGAFFGESMFSIMPDASKVALVHLVARLRARNFALLDSQFATEHLQQFGVVEIPREDYLELLDNALQITTSFVDPS
jgi:leucyl/phenylalanyl-tRNA--protein transferase